MSSVDSPRRAMQSVRVTLCFVGRAAPQRINIRTLHGGILKLDSRSQNSSEVVTTPTHYMTFRVQSLFPPGVRSTLVYKVARINHLSELGSALKSRPRGYDSR